VGHAIGTLVDNVSVSSLSFHDDAYVRVARVQTLLPPNDTMTDAVDDARLLPNMQQRKIMQKPQ
jgi:hypothetical protein